MDQQELLMQLSMLQQQSEAIEEKLKLINQHASELENLKNGLDKIEKNKEILVNIGKGIFVNAEIKDKDLLVDVGDKIIVKKTGEETKKVIDKQIANMTEIKTQFLLQLEQINANLQALVMEARKSQKD
jgi:prefoldin alpha subunit